MARMVALRTAALRRGGRPWTERWGGRPGPAGAGPSAGQMAQLRFEVPMVALRFGVLMAAAAYVGGVRPWAPAPYYGAVVAGVAIGTVIAPQPCLPRLRLNCAGTGPAPPKTRVTGTIVPNRGCRSVRRLLALAYRNRSETSVDHVSTVGCAWRARFNSRDPLRNAQCG